MRLFLGLMLCFVLASAPVLAQPKADLKKVESDLHSQKNKQKALAEKQQNIEEKLEKMRSELVDVSAEVQKHERVMLKLRDQQAETNAKIQEAGKNLENQKESLANTIVALQRLNRMPPQALLARPSAPIDMARSFGLLQEIIPAVSDKAQAMKVTFNELQALREDQQRQEQDLASEKAKLDIRQTRLEKIVKQRKTLLASNRKEQEQAARQVAALASRAGSLKDLMAKIERDNATKKQQLSAVPALKAPVEQEIKENEQIVAEKKAPEIIHKMKNWIGKAIYNLGTARMPVTGHIATPFGSRSGEGIVTQGVTIAAQSGAIVTAPSSGKVRFAGPFRQYKLLVIIQHPNGEHSLLGGMQELYTRTGARVDAGEPLGKLSAGKMAGDSSAATSLYYERRRNGKPIDPRQARG